MNPDQVLILRIVIVIAVAVLLFFLTGFIYIRNGETVFLSRHHSWRKTLDKKGWHYVLPYSYHVSRHYSSKIKKYTVEARKKQIIVFKAKIVDPIAYEYRAESYKELIKRLLKDKGYILSESDIKNSLKTIGMEVVSSEIPAELTQQ